MAASEDEVLRSHGRECRERIKVDTMCDDAGHQRLHSGGATRASSIGRRRARHRLRGLRWPRRVETKMTQSCVTSNTDFGKPRAQESREDSTEVSSRMEDGNTPVGGPLVSAEVSSRSEGFLQSRKRRSEGVCHPEDPTLEQPDWLEVRISVMSLIHKSPDVASESGRVAGSNPRFASKEVRTGKFVVSGLKTPQGVRGCFTSISVSVRKQYHVMSKSFQCDVQLHGCVLGQMLLEKAKTIWPTVEDVLHGPEVTAWHHPLTNNLHSSDGFRVLSLDGTMKLVMGLRRYETMIWSCLWVHRLS